MRGRSVRLGICAIVVLLLSAWPSGSIALPLDSGFAAPQAAVAGTAGAPFRLDDAPALGRISPDAIASNTFGATNFALSAVLGEGRFLDAARIEADRILAATPIGQSADASDRQKTRARDLIRLFLNVSRSQGYAAENAGSLDQGGPLADADALSDSPADDTLEPGDETVLDSALDAALDTDTIEMIGRIFRPTVEPTGLISFSMAGLGNFILLLSEARDGVRIVDADTGETVASYRGPGTGSSDAFGLLANRAPGLRPGPGGGRGVSLGRFLSEVWKTVVDFATEPLAILAAVLFVIMWVLWTLRSRAV